MRRPLLLLLLIGALAGLFALLRAGSGTQQEDDGPRPGPAEIDPGAPAPEPGASPFGTASGGNAGEPAGAAREATPGRRELAPHASAAVRLAGRVAVPARTPAQERALVVAFERPLDPRALWGAKGPMAALSSDPDAEPDGVLARAPIDAEGRFVLELPEARQTVHLAVVGRYLFSPATTPARRDGPEPFLAPRLGALVRGRVVPPPSLEPAVLAGGEVRLVPDLTGALEAMTLATSATRRETALDEEGRFTLPAVDPAGTLVLVARGDRFPTVFRRGLRPAPGEVLEVELSAPLPGAVSGRIRDADGAPIVGARIVARRPGVNGSWLDELRVATSDASGAFRLDALAPGPLVLSARVAGRGRARLVLAPELAPGEIRRGVDLELREGEAISGRVLLPDGSPAQGARVRAGADPKAIGIGFDPLGGGEATSDAQGRFRISGLSPGTFRVSAELRRESAAEREPGRQRPASFGAAVDGVRAGGEPIELRLDPLAELEGRALDAEGRPLSAFSVEATLAGSGGIFDLFAEKVRFSVEDATDGSFRRDGLRPGAWKVVVRAPGHAPSAEVIVELPLPAGVPGPEFVLTPTAAVHGVVLSPSGAPVPGARVEVDLDLAERVGSIEHGGVAAAYADARGAFLLEGLAGGEVSLLASARGFAPSAPVALELAPGETREDVELYLRVGATLTGEVLDSEGHAAAGRRVIVQSTPGFRRQHMASTDAAGTFRFEHLAPGTWQVVAMADFLGDVDLEGEDAGARLGALLEDLEVEVVQLADGEQTHVVLGEPPADPVTVRGQITSGGDRLPRAGVTFQPEGTRGMQGLAMALADESGAYEVTLEGAGRYLVSVNADAGTGGQNQIELVREIPAGASEFRLDLELPGGAIAGRVAGTDGEPIQGCRVTVSVDGGLAPGMNFGGHWAEARTDSEGRYRVGHLRPGTYRVAAGGPEFAGMLGGEAVAGRVVRTGVRVEFERETSGIDFELEPPATLEGVVLDATGSPLEGASVFLRDERGVPVERLSLLSTDAAGRFRYSGLAPGTYTACARHGEQASPDAPPIAVRAGETAHTSLRLAPATRLLVRTVDSEGEPLPAGISVTDERGREHAGLFSLAELMQPSDEAPEPGTRLVGPLPPGRYRVHARSADGREAQKPVRLFGQPSRHVTLRLR